MPSRRSRRGVPQRALLLAGLLAGLPTEGLAGAWTLPEGNGQVIVTSTFTTGDRLFDRRGRLVPVAEYRKFELTAFGEYGITDWATAIVAPAFMATGVDRPFPGRYEGPGQGEIGGRVRLARSDHAVASLQATALLPGASDEGNPAEIGHTDAGFDVRLLYGKSFALGGWSGFVDLQGGYRFRTDAPPDELRADFTIGLRPAERWLLLAQSFNTVSTGSGSGIFRATRYHKLQGSVVYEFAPAWSVQIGFIATGAGENAIRERGLVAGVWRRF